jgi:hypothetical protein
MPFGHGIFAGIRDEAELHGLWYQRIRYLLHPPVVGPHPFADTIREAYPWTDAQFRVPPAPPSPRPQTSHEAPLMEGGSTSADVASATDEGTLSDGR